MNTSMLMNRPTVWLGQWRMSTAHLDPGKEQVHCIHVVVLRLPEGEKLKIGIDSRFFQQVAEQLVHFDGAENIEGNGNHGQL